MSIFEKYAALYNERKFDEDERAEIGKFVAGMMKCAQAGDKGGMSKLADQFLAYASPEVLEKIGRVTTYIAFRGDERERAAVDRHITKEAFAALEKLSPHIEKTGGVADRMLQALKSVGRTTGTGFRQMGKGMAAGGKWWGKNWQPVMAMMALSGYAAPVIASGVKAITQSSSLKNSLSRLLRQHPELRNDPNVAHYFQILTTFAPHVAQNPILAGNLLKRWHETGPDLITPNMIKELLDIENQSGNIERNTQNQVNQMASGMLDIAKTDWGRKKGGPTINAPTIIEMRGGSAKGKGPGKT